MPDGEDVGGRVLGPNQPAVDGRSAAAWIRVDNGLPLTTLEYKAVYVCYGHLFVMTERQVSAVLFEDGLVVRARTVGDHRARGRVVPVSGARREVRRGRTRGALAKRALPTLSRGAAA